MTIPMRAVVSILLDSDRHPTADDLIVEVERRIPSIAPSTIYRVLSRLDELDITLLPELIGGGIPLFPAMGVRTTPTLIHAKALDRGCVSLRYRFG